MNLYIMRQWMAYERGVWLRYQDDRENIFELSLDYLIAISPESFIEHAGEIAQSGRVMDERYRDAVLRKRRELLAERDTALMERR